MYGYEWTKEYGIFRLTIDAKIQKEIRPVFHEELDFFGMDEYEKGIIRGLIHKCASMQVHRRK